VYAIVSAFLSSVITDGQVQAATPQVGGHLAALAGGAGTTTLLGLALILLVAGLVVWPAVWSRKATRRKAAVEVLDRLLRFWRR
jgi:hypothetical protein